MTDFTQTGMPETPDRGRGAAAAPGRPTAAVRTRAIRTVFAWIWLAVGNAAVHPAVTLDLQPSAGAAATVVNPGETIALTVTLHSPGSSPAAGLRYTLEFEAANWLLLDRDYAGADWVQGDGLYDASVPAQGAAGLPAVIGPDLWQRTPDVADIRFSSLRELGTEGVDSRVEELTVGVPAGTVPGRYQVGFGTVAAYDSRGVPLPVIVGSPLTISVNSRHPLRLEAADGDLLSELVFGRSEAATEGYDDRLDLRGDWPSADLPAALFLSAAGDLPAAAPLLADFRSREGVARWRLHVRVPPADSPVTLTWPVPALERGSLLLLQALADERPAGPPFDMGAAAQVMVETDTVFEIVCGSPVPARLETAAGWNLVGAPVLTMRPWSEIIRGAGISLPVSDAVWSWETHGHYRGVDAEAVPLAEFGYWLFAPTAGVTDVLVGLPADGLMRLGPGWSLISPPASVPLSWFDLGTVVWKWLQPPGCYVQVPAGEMLEPGRGYWFYVAEGAVTLRLSQP